ncbi:hypothetical protein TIFTF001_013707 [Ficus carica]|uniref:Uncharacterized protein n=1 Tax=Ficus carica TaxID=3494 RepID=A0AA88A1E4_FICCA|nr:hypothetical protein TIFTF001_013707 [Ficus carica]
MGGPTTSQRVDHSSGPILNRHRNIRLRNRRQAGDGDWKLYILDAFSGLAVYSGEVEKQGEAGSVGGEEIVSRNVESGGDFKRGVAEEVDDEGPEFGFLGKCLKDFADVRLVATRKLKEVMDRVKIGSGVVIGDGGQAVEGDVFEGGGVSVVVGVRRRVEDEDGDGEGGVVSEDELGKLHRGSQVALHAWTWKQNYCVPHGLLVPA